MRSKLFRLSDLSFMLPAIAMIALIVYAIVWNLTSPDGETIPTVGFVIAGITIWMLVLIVFMFYFKRAMFIQMYAFTTSSGVDCYFENGCPKYLQMTVESDVRRVIDKWLQYYAGTDQAPVGRSVLMGYVRETICIFKHGATFDVITPGVAIRKVYGVSSGKYMEVGVASSDTPIEKTAFGHELSHIIIGRGYSGTPDEATAHKVFEIVGV